MIIFHNLPCLPLPLSSVVFYAWGGGGFWQGLLTILIFSILSIPQARLACTTSWVSNPGETVQLLDELDALENDVISK